MIERDEHFWCLHMFPPLLDFYRSLFSQNANQPHSWESQGAHFGGELEGGGRVGGGAEEEVQRHPQAA